MTVYRKEEIPARWYYQHSRRIQAILAVADLGWRIEPSKPAVAPTRSFFFSGTIPTYLFLFSHCRN